MDQRLTRHAEVVTRYSLGLKKGDRVLIQGDVTAMPLVAECYRQAVAQGAHPTVKLTSDELKEALLRLGTEEQIKFTHGFELEAVRTLDAVLSIWGSANTRMLSSVPGERMKWASQGTAEYRKIFFERMAKGELRWCGTQHPTQGNAQEASMSLSEYQDFAYGCCLLDDPDPVARWREVEREQGRICGLLDRVQRIRIVSRDTDLSLSVAGRKWVNCCGHENFPDGEVFTCPVEDSAQGRIRFSFPGIYGGREIEDIRLEFDKGRVVGAEAAKGRDLLEQLLETDPGARLLGEVAVGTNYDITRFTRNMLFDEKIGGTVHLAIGQAFAEAGGSNQSSVHWDMLCDMKQGGHIEADGRVVYKDGKFVI
jgi:aminopeptidase